MDQLAGSPSMLWTLLYCTYTYTWSRIAIFSYGYFIYIFLCLTSCTRDKWFKVSVIHHVHSLTVFFIQTSKCRHLDVPFMSPKCLQIISWSHITAITFKLDIMVSVMSKLCRVHTQTCFATNAKRKLTCAQRVIRTHTIFSMIATIFNIFWCLLASRIGNVPPKNHHTFYIKVHWTLAITRNLGAAPCTTL